ncbi:hypothetical protein LTR28_010420 [Elasticomyces elasticus]|nr:hypothetical protein LTR28_010420 [Elasticomyces elasticus]
MARTIRAALPPPGRVDAGRGVERPAPGQLPLTPSAPPPVNEQMLPFPAHDVEILQGLGFSRQQAVAALNMTGGNLEYAAGQPSKIRFKCLSSSGRRDVLKDPKRKQNSAV